MIFAVVEYDFARIENNNHRKKASFKNKSGCCFTFIRYLIFDLSLLYLGPLCWFFSLLVYTKLCVIVSSRSFFSHLLVINFTLCSLLAGSIIALQSNHAKILESMEFIYYLHIFFSNRAESCQFYWYFQIYVKAMRWNNIKNFNIHKQNVTAALVDGQKEKMWWDNERCFSLWQILHCAPAY